jgi:oligopeptide/dipeptide ABC transporter ATP-binding protein
MYLGRIVEMGEIDDVYDHPLHPYTIALLSAIPVPDPDREATRQRIILEGDVPSPANPPSGCRFHPRCSFATDVCREDDPEFRIIKTSDNGEPHWIACHHSEQFL